MAPSVAARRQKRPIVCLSCLDLADPERILRSCPVQLSGGMNQRVAIALAMALEPAVLLADEPTSALDVTVQAQIVAELKKMRAQFGTSILVVTHNMSVVNQLAEYRCGDGPGGKIVEYGARDKRAWFTLSSVHTVAPGGCAQVRTDLSCSTLWLWMFRTRTIRS